MTLLKPSLITNLMKNSKIQFLLTKSKEDKKEPVSEILIDLKSWDLDKKEAQSEEKYLRV